MNDYYDGTLIMRVFKLAKISIKVYGEVLKRMGNQELAFTTDLCCKHHRSSIHYDGRTSRDWILPASSIDLWYLKGANICEVMGLFMTRSH